MTQQRISLHDLRGMRRAARKRLNRAMLALDAAWTSGSLNAQNDADAAHTRARGAYHRVNNELRARIWAEVYP